MQRSSSDIQTSVDDSSFFSSSVSLKSQSSKTRRHVGVQVQFKVFRKLYSSSSISQGENAPLTGVFISPTWQGETPALTQRCTPTAAGKSLPLLCSWNQRTRELSFIRSRPVCRQRCKRLCLFSFLVHGVQRLFFSRAAAGTKPSLEILLL